MPSTIPNPKNPNSLLTRDAKGRFVKSTTPKVELKVSGPVQLTTPSVPETDKPLISFTVDNPLKRFFRWLEYLKKHQSTTIALRISIPLIGIPLAVITGIQLFKLVDFPQISLPFSRSPISPTPSSIDSPSPTPLPTTYAGILTRPNQERNEYVLITQNGTTYRIDLDEIADMQPLLGKRVLITGTLNPLTNTLNIPFVSNIITLTRPQKPTTVITPATTSTPAEPEPTASESPAPTNY